MHEATENAESGSGIPILGLGDWRAGELDGTTTVTVCVADGKKDETPAADEEEGEALGDIFGDDGVGLARSAATSGDVRADTDAGDAGLGATLGDAVDGGCLFMGPRSGGGAHKGGSGGESREPASSGCKEAPRG